MAIRCRRPDPWGCRGSERGAERARAGLAAPAAAVGPGNIEIKSDLLMT